MIHTLKRELELARFVYDLDFPRLLEQEDVDYAQTAHPGTLYWLLEHKTPIVAILGGSADGPKLAPYVVPLSRDVEAVERDIAERGAASWTFASIVNQVGVFCALGVPGAEALWSRAAACLPGIGAMRACEPELMNLYWGSALAALAMDVPAIYRARSTPSGPSFGADPASIIGYFAAQVEAGASLASCEPAWHAVLASHSVTKGILDEAALVWLAIVLHHRIAGRPLATAADYLRDSAAAVVASGAPPVQGPPPRPPELAAAFSIVTPPVAGFGRQVAELAASLALLEADTAAGQVGGAVMTTLDRVAVLAALGAPDGEPLLPRVAKLLPSIGVSRHDADVAPYWNRAFAALALDVHTIYRPAAGFDLTGPLPFKPGAVFDLNLQALLAHLVAAVEQRAPIAACEPAWRNLLARYPLHASSRSLSPASLVWLGAILHHRIAGAPLATVAAYVRDSLAALPS